MSDRRIGYTTYSSEQWSGDPQYASATRDHHCPTYRPSNAHQQDVYAYDASVYGSPSTPSPTAIYAHVDQPTIQSQPFRRSSHSHAHSHSHSQSSQSQPATYPQLSHQAAYNAEPYVQPSTSPRARPRSHSQAGHPYPATPSASFVPRQNAAYQYPPEVSLTAAQDNSQYPATPPRPFSCPLCSLSFNRHHDLKRHQETHSGEKPFSCNGKCGKTFTRKDALKRHQLVKKCGTVEETWS